jgi:hypothetical protein
MAKQSVLQDFFDKANADNNNNNNGDFMIDALLRQVYEIEELSVNQNTGYVKYRDKVYNGILKRLAERYYSDYSLVERKRGGSSIEQGIRIHRQLYHTIHCAKICECDCEIKTIKLSQMTLNAQQKFKEIDFTPEDAEVPVLCSQWNLATKLDIVGYLWKGTNRQASCIVSIKTGYNIGRTQNRHRQTLEEPLNHIPSTPQNHHQLQGLAELCIVRKCYGLPIKYYKIIYLSNDYKDTFVEDPSDWWGDNRFKDQVFFESMISK